MQTKDSKIEAIISLLVTTNRSKELIQSKKFKYKLPNSQLEYHVFSKQEELDMGLNDRNAIYKISKYGDSLRTVEIHPDIKSLPIKFFKNCSQLQCVQLPNTLNELNDFCFTDCESLEEINIPSKVRVIPNCCFGNCKSLKNITLPNGLIELARKCFYNSGLNEIYIPSSVTKIGSMVFFGCDSLRKVVFDTKNNITEVPEGLFSMCANLSFIELPNTIISIENIAFRFCTSLRKVKLPEELLSIGESAFIGCTSLQSLSIPSAVSTIGNKAFYGCRSLRELDIPLQLLSESIFDFNNMPKLRHIQCNRHTLLSLEDKDTLKNITRNDKYLLVQYSTEKGKLINVITEVENNNILEDVKLMHNKELNTYFDKLYEHPIFEKCTDNKLKIKLCLNIMSTLQSETAISFLDKLYSNETHKDIVSTKDEVTFSDRIKSFFSNIIKKIKTKNIENNVEQNVQRRSGINNIDRLITLFGEINSKTNITDFNKFFELNIDDLVADTKGYITSNMAKLQQHFNRIMSIPELKEDLENGKLTIDNLAKKLLSNNYFKNETFLENLENIIENQTLDNTQKDHVSVDSGKTMRKVNNETVITR